jgi:uncharacterized Zn-binding protein involved in type VI secretion
MLAAQHGVNSEGTCGCIPTANISPVTKTFIEGKLATVRTSTHPNHPQPPPCGSHSRNTTGGSNKTTIEGNAAGRKGDSIVCGDTLGTTATKTFIG